MSTFTLLGGMVLLVGCAAAGAEKNPEPHPRVGQPWAVPLSIETALDMVWIAPGTFVMGSPADEPGRKTDEAPTTKVTLTHGYWLGKTEVTVAQWRSVMGTDLRAQLTKVLRDDTLYDFGERKQTVRDFMAMSRDADPGTYLANEADRLPMYFVSWNDAAEFCRQLTVREKAAGRLPPNYVYTLPTEAEWEYACRAGTTDATFGGPLATQERRARVLDDIAWYVANSTDGYIGKGLGPTSAGPRNAGEKYPNAWGLRDMPGNLWEWCRDWYGPYSGGSAVDPTGPSTGTDRVNRGGSWGSGARDERSANRARNPPAEASAYRGFRVSLSFAP